MCPSIGVKNLLGDTMIEGDSIVGPPTSTSTSLAMPGKTMSPAVRRPLWVCPWPSPRVC